MTTEPRSFAARPLREAAGAELGPVDYGPGFHDLEYEQGRPFRWMAREAVFRLGPADEGGDRRGRVSPRGQ